MWHLLYMRMSLSTDKANICENRCALRLEPLTYFRSTISDLILEAGLPVSEDCTCIFLYYIYNCTPYIKAVCSTLTWCIHALSDHVWSSPIPWPREHTKVLKNYIPINNLKTIKFLGLANVYFKNQVCSNFLLCSITSHLHYLWLGWTNVQCPLNCYFVMNIFCIGVPC